VSKRPFNAVAAYWKALCQVVLRQRAVQVCKTWFSVSAALLILPLAETVVRSA